MADVAEADSQGGPAATESPLLSRASSALSGTDQRSSNITSQRSVSLPHTTGVKSPEEVSAKASPSSGFSQWARGFRLPTSSEASPSGEAAKYSPFSLLTSGFGKRTPKTTGVEASDESTSPTVTSEENNAFNNFTKGFLDSSRSAVKAVQLKARHLVSQNKRRYQEGGFDLDMAYITENIIAMGFPAGDMSSGLLGYVEGFYRNHMEEVIKFFETHHKGKYKVYNLCSERLYDASLFEGKVACFPFDDHNCPPLQLIAAFCQSAYSWLKGDLENVVVVHCKAGMARTGLMITCLLLYLKFFPTAEESINYYNQKRCVDGKGLILPSQLRYVKYFERVLREFNGETPQGRKCILRGIRLHKCPYWIRPAVTISDHNGVLFSSKKHPRTKELLSEDIWFSAPRKGVVVFALPGERCVADLNGDFKVHFNDRHGDFYCWLNTNMMETRQILPTTELDGFEKRRLPSPGFQVEVVILDHDAPIPKKKTAETEASQSAATGSQATTPANAEEGAAINEGTGRSAPDTDAVAGIGGDGDNVTVLATSEKKHRMKDFLKSADGHAGNESLGSKGDDANLSSGPREASLGTSTTEVGEQTKDSLNDDRTAFEKLELSQGESTMKSKESGAGPLSNLKDTSEVMFRRDGSPRDAAVAPSDFKAIAAASAADASVFTFGDDDDYDSEEEHH